MSLIDTATAALVEQRYRELVRFRLWHRRSGYNWPDLAADHKSQLRLLVQIRWNARRIVRQARRVAVETVLEQMAREAR